MSEPIRHIRRFLCRSDPVAALFEQLARNERLLQRVRDALPSDVQPHCQHVAFDAGRLTVLTDSPVWLSRLRFLMPQVVATLQAAEIRITDSRLRVVPMLPTASEPEGKGATGLSPLAGACLLEAAKSVQDPALSESLRRLARHAHTSD